MTTNVFVYPLIEDRAQTNDLVSRLAWYMAPYLDSISAINISAADAVWVREAELAPHMDPYVASLIPKVIAKIKVVPDQELTKAIEAGDKKKDILLLVDSRAEETMTEGMKVAKAAYLANAGLYRVDAKRTRQEGSFYLWCGLNKFTDAKFVTAENKIKLAEMVKEIGHYRNAFVFGTGPSFSDYVDGHDFADCLCIAANSVIKNKAALAKLKPKIICAADPIYHAGCSSYAGAFRVSLREALEETGAWFICPLRDSAVYRAYLPEHLLKRMICIPFDSTSPIPVDLAKSFHINPFPNVLTLLLLPLASTFADTIHIVGCDGRKLLDDSFFWSHDKKVQFNDQMTEIQAAHPGFFAIDYNDYYLDHCRDLEKVLVAIEDAGHSIVTETTSLIPALSSRERQSLKPNLTTFVMLDPDAKDDWGHFLAYDKRLAAAAKALGLDFYLLSRKELADKFIPRDATALIPVFTVNSWTVGNKNPAERVNVLRFATELDDGLKQVEKLAPEGEICVFFYVGSLEVAEVLEFLLSDHPRVHAVINLFWSYAHDQNDPKYRDRWRPVARRLNANPRVHLMHSTGQIAREFETDWDIALPVLQHPSTTFSDETAHHLARQRIAPKAATEEKRFRVIFPGGARAEKGFVLSIEAVSQLRGAPCLDLALRARLDKVSGTVLKKAYDALDKSGIEILDSDLSDEQFIEMIANSDIVVIPYHQEAFRRRTSGILVDAMLMGKPVVVLENTWLADEVNIEQIGVCAEPTADGIVHAIKKITDDYFSFAARIENARCEYLRKNSWNSLTKTVVALAMKGARFAGSQSTAASAAVVPNHVAIQLELEQLRESFSALSAFAQKHEKFTNGVGFDADSTPFSKDFLTRLQSGGDVASSRMLLTSIGSGLLAQDSGMLGRLKHDTDLTKSIETALGVLAADDPHKVHFMRVRARFGETTIAAR